MATMQLIIHQRSDERLNDAVDLMGKLARAQKDFSDLSIYFHDLESIESRAIINVLNFREFVSVGINSGILDEETYKRSYYSLMLRDWKNLRKTIEAIRTSRNGSPTNFQEFEKLVYRWEQKPIRKFATRR